MSTEDDLVKHLDQVNTVVSEYLKGNDPTVISKELDIPRTRVVTLINEWKVMASANDAIRARAKEALAAMRASDDSSFNISTSFVATSAATIPASTSPVPAVANHGVAFGSSINCLLSATKVMAPFSRTVTFKVSVAI
jgi:hypothetical protein